MCEVFTGKQLPWIEIKKNQGEKRIFFHVLVLK